MVYLPDVNVLIALLDRFHVQHETAHEWFGHQGHVAWATCPLTENGVMRIVGHSRYPNSPGTPAAVAPLVTSLCALPGHRFWPDALSLCNSEQIDVTRLLDSSQVTDTYLLGLARSHGGRLATLDRRLVTSAVRDGRQALLLIE